MVLLNAPHMPGSDSIAIETEQVWYWLRFQSLHLHNLLVHSVTILVKEKNRLAPLYLTFVQLELESN